MYLISALGLKKVVEWTPQMLHIQSASVIT